MERPETNYNPMAAAGRERSPTNCNSFGRHQRPLSMISSATTFVDGDFDEGIDDSLPAKSSVIECTWRDTPHGKADRFVHEKGPQIHPIFSGLTPCEEQRAEKRAKEVEHDVLSAATDHFYRVIETYRNRSKDDSLLDDFDIRKTHTWDEVFRAASLAQEKCKQDGKRSFLKTIGRGAQKSSPAMAPWLKLIPSGNYTSALCGGLKIAFNVANRIHEQRADIYETFENIPETIQRAGDHLKDWPKDDVLYDAVTDLYLAVLKAIEAMIEWLVGRSTWKKIGPVLMKPESSTPTDLGVDDVQKALQRLSNRATALQSMAIARTDANAQKIRDTVDAIDERAHRSEKMWTEMYWAATDTNKTVKDAHDGTVNFLIDQLKNSETQKIIQERRHRKELRILKKENEVLKLKEVTERAYRMQHIEEYQIWASTLTQDQLADFIGIYPGMLEQDLKKVTKEGKRSAPASQSRGYWLWRNAKFQAWLTSINVRTLMVNGNTHAYEKITAMSYACALLIQSLAEVKAVVTISFFCGLHNSHKDPLDGPTGLLKALISQLLGVQDFDPAFVDPRYEEGLQRLDFWYLTDLFRKLVEQLPDDLTLFCIIDGTSFYEKPRYDGKIEAVIRMLHEISDDSNTAPIFKFIMVSPVITKYAKACFSSSNRLIVPTDCGNGQLLTIRQTKRRTSERMCIQEEPVNSTHNPGVSELEDEGSGEKNLNVDDFSDSASETSSGEGDEVEVEEDEQHEKMSGPAA